MVKTVHISCQINYLMNQNDLIESKQKNPESSWKILRLKSHISYKFSILIIMEHLILKICLSYKILLWKPSSIFYSMIIWRASIPFAWSDVTNTLLYWLMAKKPSIYINTFGFVIWEVILWHNTKHFCMCAIKL